MIKEEIMENIALLTIDHPPANALSLPLLDMLQQKLMEIKENSHVKVIIIKGENKFFSAGADIKGFTALQNEADYVQLARKGQSIFDNIENYPLPIIAAIHGAALGGGFELALACHIRIATVSAKLGLPELHLGIIPGFGGTQRLPRLVGAAKAYEMILTGEAIDGEEAYRIGAVNKLVTEEDLLPAAMKLATLIAHKSKPTILHTMKLITATKENPLQSGLDQEANAFGDVFGNKDAKEGIQAFLEKRPPHFTDG